MRHPRIIRTVVVGTAWLGACLLALDGGDAKAAAFNEPAGQGLAIVSGTLDGGDRSFDTRGRLVKGTSYAKREGALYIEYGVTDWLQAIIKPDLVATHLGGAGGARYAGLGTSEVGAQVQALLFGPAALAVQGTFQLPATTSQRNPALVGNTARGADLRALLGVVFPIGRWPSFFNAEAAYRFRGSGAPDEVHLDLTLGVRVLPRLLVLLQDFTTVPTAPGVPYFPRSTYSKAALSLVYDLDARWSLQLGVFTTVEGRNALRERAVQAAVWYRF